MFTFSCEIEQGEVMGLVGKYGLGYKDSVRAFNRAIADTLRHMRAVTVRNLKGEIPQLQNKILSLRASPKWVKRTSRGGDFFVGLDDVPVKFMKYKKRGKAPRQGVEVPGIGLLPRTFYSQTRDRPFQRVGKGRLPIIEPALPIHEQAEPIIADVMDQEITYFWSRLEHHMKWLKTA